MRPHFGVALALVFTALTPSLLGPAAIAQTGARQPLYKQQPAICIGGGFVAMIGRPRHAPLVVIKIDRTGIQPPREMPISGDFYGIKCGVWGVELEIQKDGSDHFSIVPFELEHGIEQEPSEDIDYSLSKGAPMPVEVQRRLSEFYGMGLLPLTMHGDWYAQVPRVGSRSVYEVHFVETQTQGNGQQWWNVAIDLLEETRDKKVVKSVPLVREKAAVVYD